MQPDFVQQALKALRPEAPDWYGWAKVDADGNKIPNDQRMCWEHAIVIQDGVTKPTKEEFDAKVAELKAAYDEANAPYKLDRASAYPSIQEQLDMQYWDSVNGTTTWADAIAKVKADYPKGAE
jgi:hypothetical protein